MNRLIFYTFIILFSLTSTANELDQFIEEIVPKTSLSNEQLKHLREELRVQKIMIEEVQSLKMKGVSLANLDSDTSINKIQNMLLRSAEAKETTVTKEISAALKRGMNFENFKSSMSKFKNFLNNAFVNKKAMGASLIRQYGMEVGIIYLASLQIDLTLPLVMISQGHLGYSVLLATPVSSVVTGGYVAIKNAVKFRQVAKSFNGLGKAFNYYKEFFKVKKFFNQNILSKTDLIDITVNNKTFIATATKENFLKKAINKLGYNDRLNYSNVIKLLEKHNLMEDFLYAIKATSKPNGVKLLRILNRVSLTQDEKIMNLIAENFSRDIKHIDKLVDFPQFKKWAIDIAHSTSIDSFISKLAHMPKNIPPKVLDRFWRTYIIPTSSKNIRPYMSKDIRKTFGLLISNYDKNLFGEFAQSIDLELSPNLHKKFIDYMYESMGKIGLCQGLFKKKGSNAPLLIQY